MDRHDSMENTCKLLPPYGNVHISSPHFCVLANISLDILANLHSEQKYGLQQLDPASLKIPFSLELCSTSIYMSDT